MNTVTIGIEEFDSLRKQKQKHVDFVDKLRNDGKVVYHGSHGGVYSVYNDMDSAAMAKECEQLKKEVRWHKIKIECLEQQEKEFNTKLARVSGSNKLLILSSLLLMGSVLYFLIFN